VISARNRLAIAYFGLKVFGDSFKNEIMDLYKRNIHSKEVVNKTNIKLIV